MREIELSRPTDSELSILRVLCRQGESTVRQVFEALSQGREVGYTTVLKLMQIMTEKDLVERDESERTHVYRARLTQEQTQRRLVGDLLGQGFWRFGVATSVAGVVGETCFGQRTEAHSAIAGRI